MIYDLSNPLQREQFKARCNRLYADNAVVELASKVFRSRNQNSYLHLLIGVVAMETGNSIPDAKEWYYKRICNHDLFFRQKRDKMGNTIEVMRSSADLTTEEMSMSIDRFKRWGAEQGIYLPEPGDEAMLKQIEIELGRNKQYLGNYGQ